VRADGADPAPPPAAARPTSRRPRVANPCSEEPDALVGHVQIRGSPGGQPPGRPDIPAARRARSSEARRASVSPTLPRAPSCALSAIGGTSENSPYC
jgi:hypothetical protein